MNKKQLRSSRKRSLFKSLHVRNKSWCTEMGNIALNRKIIRIIAAMKGKPLSVEAPQEETKV